MTLSDLLVLGVIGYTFAACVVSVHVIWEYIRTIRKDPKDVVADWWKQDALDKAKRRATASDERGTGKVLAEVDVVRDWWKHHR